MGFSLVAFSFIIIFLFLLGMGFHLAFIYEKSGKMCNK